MHKIIDIVQNDEEDKIKVYFFMKMFKNIITDRISESYNAIASVRPFVSTADWPSILMICM